MSIGEYPTTSSTFIYTGQRVLKSRKVTKTYDSQGKIVEEIVEEEYEAASGYYPNYPTTVTF